ncbi:MAG: hypothetical protein F6J93_35250 [Oscillatoria sp. SIO1A7]|nr:hypothetical protein [Oscillatoria sp. SIO1A7]
MPLRGILSFKILSFKIQNAQCPTPNATPDLFQGVCFLDLAFLKGIEDATRGVGATAFPRQLLLFKKSYCIGMLRPRNPCSKPIPSGHAKRSRSLKRIIKNIPADCPPIPSQEGEIAQLPMRTCPMRTCPMPNANMPNSE